jgi:hypothetical protein
VIWFWAWVLISFHRAVDCAKARVLCPPNGGAAQNRKGDFFRLYRHLDRVWLGSTEALLGLYREREGGHIAGLPYEFAAWRIGTTLPLAATPAVQNFAHASISLRRRPSMSLRR